MDLTPIDVERELAALLIALDAVSDQVQRWGRDLAPEHDPAWVGPTGGAGSVVSGEGPDAAEERSIRGAAATLARTRSQEVGEELAEITDRARRMAEQARASREASQARRERDAHQTLEAAPGGGGVRNGVALGLRGAAAQLAGCEDAEQAMDRIVAGALQVTTRARWGGFCVQGRRSRRDQVDVHVASHPLVERLEALQASDGGGPCVQALTSTDTVYLPDLLRERRWPHFAYVAAALGVRSVLAVGLPVSAPGGVLTLYSPHPDGFDEQTRAVVGVFAEHAATALSGARRVGQLARAVASRDVIGQAKGMLMVRHGVDAERAFQLLVEASQNSNLKLVDVARWTVENTGAL